MKSFKILAILAALGTANAYCMDVTVTNIKLDSVSVIAVPFGLHRAGNMEIAITGGFVAPPGLQCSDHYHVTTLQSSDPDRAMLALLDDIRWSPTASAGVTITDAPGLTAYPGRCSLRSVGR